MGYRLQQQTSDSAKRPRNFGSQSQSSCTGDVNWTSGSKFWWIPHPPQHKVPRGDKLPPAPLRMKYLRTFHYPLPNTELPTKSNTDSARCSSSYDTTGRLNVVAYLSSSFSYITYSVTLMNFAGIWNRVFWHLSLLVLVRNITCTTHTSSINMQVG